MMIGEGIDRFDRDREYREWVMDHLIRPADMGICGVETEREPVPAVVREQFVRTSRGSKLPEETVVVSFKHDGAPGQTIDFAVESSGTRKLFNLRDDWSASPTVLSRSLRTN